MKLKNKNIDFGKLRKELLGSSIFCIELPPCEIDIIHNCYWLEEAQGDTSENLIRKCQIKLYLDIQDIRTEIIVGVERTVYESTKQTELLYNLNFNRNTDLIVKEMNNKLGAINPASYITRLDFKLSEIELWNVKTNEINLYLDSEVQLGNILILRDNNGKEIFIEGFESDDQENCLKLTIADIDHKTFKLKKEYEWERVHLGK